jgi:hypothetical protein
MCQALRWSKIGAVDRQTVVIRLELGLINDSLTGRASDGTGAAREFTGWMGLLAAIDALIPASSPASTAPDSINPRDGGAAS